MKSLLLFLFLTCTAFAKAQDSIAIIPEPVSINKGNGSYALPQNPTISIPDAPANNIIRELLQQKLGAVRFIDPSTASVKYLINKKPVSTLGKEGYTLDVNASGITITANAPAGLYYGTQTLLQLLPPSIESVQTVTSRELKLPIVSITDYPRFGWRGLMFDVSRHFFTKEEVKRFINDMVKYKYNLLHLHLADDEGWRIEIKGLPRLTEVGAWRADKTGYFGTFAPPRPDEPRSYGGFFTQDDIRELVRYAKDRFVDILPEIDVAGS